MKLRSKYDREILLLGLPALGALASEPLYVLVDTAIVGHLGRPQLAALGIAGALLTGLYGLFNFLAYATTAHVARYDGAGQRRLADSVAAQSLWLSLGVGVVLLAFDALEQSAEIPRTEAGVALALNQLVEEGSGFAISVHSSRIFEKDLQ